MRIARPAATNASTGAISAGTMTFSISPSAITPLEPTAANVEPTMPPISACEDDDGNPKYQVSRFQAIAPTNPEKTIGSVMTLGSTMPLAIVAATASDRNAPTKFKDAAIATATRGAIARV